MHLRQVLNCRPGLGFSTTYHRPELYPTGSSLLLLFRATPPPENEPPFTEGRFDALATCHLEGLRVRRGWRGQKYKVGAGSEGLTRGRGGEQFVQQGFNHLARPSAFGISGLAGRSSYHTTPG